VTTGFHTTHTFVSAKADGTDNTLVKPSNWNEDHTLVMDSGKILGRQTAGNGAVEQLDCSAAAAALLSQADIAAILTYLGVSPPTTGDGKITLKTAADTGWVLLDDGTIGNATSGASNRANADAQALFTLLYDNLTDTTGPVLTSSGVGTTRGAQGIASTAFANSCRISLPKQLGRAFIAAGTGSGLTARALGATGGEETHALTSGENASHTHAVTDPGHVHGLNNIKFSQTNVAGGINSNAYLPTGSFASGLTSDSATTGISIQSSGSGTPHNNMQPWTAWNVMVKL
jgi:microcystin-dependent protein